ncbi:MAG: hypothetical protein JNG90_15865, partial [Planctomycetaceae bacterium]|nr:hypothetical protein [Planctomycetaceae bacterium]
GVRWDYFERLNHRATAQTMGLPVDGFLAQVGEPTEAQLQALYQAHRDDYSFPDSPEPGFHEPEKGKFDYFKADYEKFASTIEVSDADIRDYYEKNKQSQFLYSGFQVAPPKTVEPAKETEPAAEEKAPAPETPESSPAASEAAPSTDAPPSDPPTGDTPGEGPQGNGGDDAGAQEAEASEPAPAAESTANEPAAAVATPETTPPSEAAPPAEGGEPDPATAASENPPAADDKPADAAAAKPAVPSIEPDESLMLPDSILDGPNPDYEPLWRVEERIRELLRRQRVGDKVRVVFQRLADAVDEYANQLADHELLTQEQGAEKAGPAPQTPDWAKLAAENGVEFASTPLVSPFNVAETELGKSIVNGNQMFAEAAFAALRLRTPRNSADADGNQFLFWKVEEKRDFVPSFEEALEAVTRAWKFQQARELALKKAQELAQQVNTAGKTLQEVFGDAGTYQVSETGEFSWLTESAARSPDGAPTVPQLTELPGVDRAGSEFMRTVFNLQPSQAGAALNAPQTVAYVVQVTNFSPADVVLRESFMVAPYRTYMGAGLEEERDLVQNWIAQLEQEAGLDWVRPPDQRMQ